MNCPFCGNNKVTVTSKYVSCWGDLDYRVFHARCTKCRASGPYVSGYARWRYITGYIPKDVEYFDKEYYEEKAKERWNERI